jgi:photosystem II stability/assembly factor-like uncharacterized protein
MRRSCMKIFAFVGRAVLFGSFITLSGTACAQSANASFDVLNRPSLRASPSHNAILSVTKAGTRLVAVGERGVILLSDDDGKTWRQATVPVTVTLTAVQFVNDRLGWAVGHLGVVLHTSDGGVNWTRQLDGIRLAAIALQEAQALKNQPPGPELAEAQRLVKDGPDKPFLDLYFENERTGYVVGAYNLAFRTDDGGRTWRSWMGRMANPNKVHLYGIRAVGDAIYIAGEQGLLLRSTDKGQQFTSIPSPSKGSYFGLVSGPKGELVIYGLQGRAFFSANSGDTWSQVETGSKSAVSAGMRSSDGTIILATQAGELLTSIDGGQSFKSTRKPASVPVTGLAEVAGGSVVVSSMRGLRVLNARSVFP